jgi:hypothetical protein
MKQKSIIALLFTLSTISCSNDDERSPLLGTWITEACAQASDIDGTPIERWVRGLYKFNFYGDIEIGHNSYSDSDCTHLIDNNSPSDLDTPLIFVDNGDRTLLEGISGRALSISFGEGEELILNDGFYTINSGSLCFSEVFIFEPVTFDVSKTGDKQIDFERCLTRP